MILSTLRVRWKTRRMRQVFRRIHAARAWDGGESSSGPGSTRERAAAFLPELLALVQSLRISVLLDAPCGDLNWAEPLAAAVPRYIGVDVVPALIRDNLLRRAAPNREFRCLDFVHERLPAADLILCRDALVHFSHSDALTALANFRRTGARYLIATTFVGDRPNPDIATGGWRPLNLERPPFRFPPPLASIDERRELENGLYRDKRLSLWQFCDLPAGKAGPA